MPDTEDTQFKSSDNAEPGLLARCWQIRREALDMFHVKNEFVIKHYSSKSERRLERTLTVLGNHKISLIKCFVLISSLSLGRSHSSPQVIREYIKIDRAGPVPSIDYTPVPTPEWGSPGWEVPRRRCCQNHTPVSDMERTRDSYHKRVQKVVTEGIPRTFTQQSLLKLVDRLWRNKFKPYVDGDHSKLTSVAPSSSLARRLANITVTC